MSRSGAEGRYRARFLAYAGATRENIKQVDEAKDLAENLNVAVGSLEGIQRDIDTLFDTARGGISDIDKLQMESGVKQVENLTAVKGETKGRYGQKMGYTKMTLEFALAGMMHFMEETIRYRVELDDSRKLISQLALAVREVPVVGALQEPDASGSFSMAPITNTIAELSDDSDSDEEIDKPRANMSASVTPALRDPPVVAATPVTPAPAAQVKSISTNKIVRPSKK